MIHIKITPPSPHPLSLNQSHHSQPSRRTSLTAAAHGMRASLRMGEGRETYHSPGAKRALFILGLTRTDNQAKRGGQHVN